jgi:hypothetical protein
MRTTSPKSSNQTPCFRIRTIRITFNEAGDFDLLGGEDMKRKKMGEAVIFAVAERMKDWIVGDAKVSSHQIDEDLRVRYGVIVGRGHDV